MSEQSAATGDFVISDPPLGVSALFSRFSLRSLFPTPLLPIVRPCLKFVPLIVVLGSLAGLLEGVSIGALIPLIAVLLAETVPAGLPGPIRALGTALAHFDDDARLAILAGVILALIILKSAVQALANQVIVSIEMKLARDILRQLVGRILSLDFGFFLAADQARLIHVVGKDSWSTSEAIRAAMSILPAIAGLAVFAALLLYLDPQLCFVVATIGAAIVLLLRLMEAVQRRLSALVTRENRRLGQRMLSIVTGIQVIKVFDQEAFEQNRFAIACDNVIARVRATGRVSGLVSPLLDVMLALMFVSVVVAGYLLHRPVTAVTAFLVLLTRAQPLASLISRARIEIAGRRGAVREVEWLLTQRPSLSAAPSKGIVRAEARASVALDAPIRFDNVSYRYPQGEHAAISHVNLTIEPGEATALIGESGSGKSTIVHLLTRLVEPTEGRINLGNQAAGAFEPSAWRARMAIAGQDIELLAGTVAENIAYGCPDASVDDIRSAARAAGVESFIDRLPQGYDTMVGNGGSGLSGGQRQRIGLARALFRRPDLLILDEATNAVDALSEREILRLLAEHSHFYTALVVSHRRSTLAGCKNGIVVETGRVTATGPLADLAYYRAMGEQRHE